MNACGTWSSCTRSWRFLTNFGGPQAVCFRAANRPARTALRTSYSPGLASVMQTHRAACHQQPHLLLILLVLRRLLLFFLLLLLVLFLHTRTAYLKTLAQ